jgi:hypothetical protein
MGFTDFLFPASTLLYPPAATVLESYTDHFDLSAEYTLNEVSPSGKKCTHGTSKLNLSTRNNK